MKTIFITEDKLQLLNSNDDREVTFYEFLTKTKSFLKDLLNKPNEAKPDELFNDFGYSKEDLINKMKDLNMIQCDEKIDEVSVENEKGVHKKVAKHSIKYKIPRKRFNEKLHELYKDLFSPKETVTEEGEGMGGATNCSGVLGGANPSAGTYDAPIGGVQRRKFYTDALSRNKDEKNGSISMNRVN